MHVHLNIFLFIYENICTRRYIDIYISIYMYICMVTNPADVEIPVQKITEGPTARNVRKRIAPNTEGACDGGAS